MKTIRETMREKGVLKDFLKSHKYDPGQKYRFGNLGDFSVLDEPMSYMDVSATIARMPWTLLPRRRAPCPPSLGLTPSSKSAVGDCSKNRKMPQ